MTRPFALTVTAVVACVLWPFATPVAAQDEKVMVVTDGSVIVRLTNSELSAKENDKQKWSGKARSITVMQGSNLPPGCNGGTPQPFESLTIFVREKTSGDAYEISAKNEGFLFKKLKLSMFGDIAFRREGSNIVLQRDGGGGDFEIYQVSVRRHPVKASRVHIPSETDSFCIRFSNRRVE